MSEVRHYKPPRLAEALLGWLLSDALWQTPVGDFEEYYNEVAAQRGVRRARAWYWGQVLKLLPDRLYEKTHWGTIMLTNYLKIAFRNLRKHKGYAAINIFGLALGMACCILILLFVQYELSFDRFHTKADQIYRLVEIQTFSGRSPEHVGLTMGMMGQAMVDEYPEITNYARFSSTGDLLTRYKDKQLYMDPTFYADSSVFEMFDFELIAGDPETALDEPFTIVITEEAARRFFEDADPIGAVLQVDGTDYRVTGVLKDVPENSHLQFEALMRKLGWTSAVGKPFALGGGNKLGTVVGVVKDFHFYSLHHKIEPLVLFVWPGRLNHLYARIRPENMTETLAYLEDQWQKREPDWPFEYAFLDERFAQLYQSEARIGKVFGTFSLLAIVIACLGLFGLVAFTAEQRTKEIGVRKVMGASVVNIVLLLSKDFTRLVGIAILIAMPIAYVAMQRWLENFAYRIEIPWGLFLTAGLLAILIAWLTVSYQSIKAALADPVKALRHE